MSVSEWTICHFSNDKSIQLIGLVFKHNQYYRYKNIYFTKSSDMKWYDHWKWTDLWHVCVVFSYFRTNHDLIWRFFTEVRSSNEKMNLGHIKHIEHINEKHASTQRLIAERKFAALSVLLPSLWTLCFTCSTLWDVRLEVRLDVLAATFEPDTSSAAVWRAAGKKILDEQSDAKSTFTSPKSNASVTEPSNPTVQATAANSTCWGNCLNFLIRI